MTKIVELRAQGFARLSAVSIRPDGALVQITGKNSQGKTSILNSIWTALKGRAVAPPEPINKNAEQALLQLDLGTMKIARSFRRDKNGEITTDLKVTMADGGRVGTKPQLMIDAMLGDLTFNPLEFARLPAKAQFERVKSLVPGFDFDTNKSERDVIFAERTNENRRAKELRAAANSVVLPPGPKPKVQDVSALSEELRKAVATNRRIESLRNAQRTLIDDIERKRDEAERLRARADALDRTANEQQQALDADPAIPDVIDTDAIAAQIASADGLRLIAAKHEERERFENSAAEAESFAHRLTELIAEKEAERRAAIEGAQMPVDGLAFGDDEVLLNGLPFAGAGTAEKIRASVGIAMALNPDLRVMLIDEGSELDSESLALVGGLAEQHDYQVWVCRVAEGEAAKAGFEIVDGTVAE